MSFQAFPKALRHPGTQDVKIAKTPDEQMRFEAQGYEEPGQANPEAFVKAQDFGDPEPEHEEWPKWIDGKLTQNPNPEPVRVRPGDYPKMVNGQVVHTLDEELDLMDRDEEMAMPAHERAAERSALMAEATKAGLRVDGRWGIERLRAVVRGQQNHHHSSGP